MYEITMLNEMNPVGVLRTLISVIDYFYMQTITGLFQISVVRMNIFSIYLSTCTSKETVKYLQKYLFIK